MFTSTKQDKNHFYMKDNPIVIVAANIATMAGGRASPWDTSMGKSGLHNPYAKKGSQTEISHTKKLN